MIIKEVKPLFTGVVTTAKKLIQDRTTEGGLILTNQMEGTLNTFQTVVAVGTTVQGIKPGDVVKCNFKRYIRQKHVPGSIDNDNIQHDNFSFYYEIPTVDINGVEHLLIQNNDIEYVAIVETDDGGLLQ